MMKRFLEWIGLKEKLHSQDHEPPLVRERDIWWVSFGDNVGSEINGKSKLFTRPGIILKKLSRKSFLVLHQQLNIVRAAGIQSFDMEIKICISVFTKSEPLITADYIVDWELLMRRALSKLKRRLSVSINKNVPRPCGRGRDKSSKVI